MVEYIYYMNSSKPSWIDIIQIVELTQVVTNLKELSGVALESFINNLSLLIVEGWKT
jgi:hypothetical protein